MQKKLLPIFALPLLQFTYLVPSGVVIDSGYLMRLLLQQKDAGQRQTRSYSYITQSQKQNTHSD